MSGTYEPVLLRRLGDSLGISETDAASIERDLGTRGSAGAVSGSPV